MDKDVNSEKQDEEEMKGAKIWNEESKISTYQEHPDTEQNLRKINLNTNSMFSQNAKFK